MPSGFKALMNSAVPSSRRVSPDSKHLPGLPTATEKPMLFTTAGSWAALNRDPMPGAAVLDADFDTERERAGYEPWGRYPDTELDPDLWLEVYRHGFPTAELPQFCISVDTRARGEVVYAESTPALMDLLARWMPAVQGAMLSAALEQLDPVVAKYASPS